MFHGSVYGGVTAGRLWINRAEQVVYVFDHAWRLWAALGSAISGTLCSSHPRPDSNIRGCQVAHSSLAKSGKDKSWSLRCVLQNLPQHKQSSLSLAPLHGGCFGESSPSGLQARPIIGGYKLATCCISNDCLRLVESACSCTAQAIRCLDPNKLNSL